MKKIYKLITYCFLFITGILSCTNGNSSSYSIIEDSSCTLPCWHNIVLGKTDENEFIEAVSKLKFLQKDTITIINRSSEIYDKEIRFIIQPDRSWFNNNPIQVEAYLFKGKVVAINFFGVLGLTFGDIIQNYERSNYLYTLILPNNYRVVSVINETENLAFQYRTYESEITLEYTTPITALFLFYEDIYNDLMDEGLFSMGLLNSSEISKIIYPWNGYGNLDEKYPPRQP